MTSKPKIPQFTIQDLYAVETERSRRDGIYFVDEYVRIEDRDKVGIVIPFKLWEEQRNVLSHFIADRLVQVMKANQLGLSWLADAYSSWRLLFNSGYLILGISETEIKAKEMIRRIDFIFRHLPKWMVTDKEHRTDGIPWYESTALSITIHHPKKDGRTQEDSVMQAFASSPKSGASFTANLFIFDEWALQEYAREIWTYAFPTINRPTGGQVLGLSTIERGSLFEEIWKNTKNSFVKIFLPWSVDPRRDQTWYDNTVIEMGIDETHKHYPATVEEAFAIPGGAFFSEFRSTVNIKEPLRDIPDWYYKYRFMDYGFDMLACYWAYIDRDGRARIYREVHKPDLVISEAAYEIHKANGCLVPETLTEWDRLTEAEKQKIANGGEKIVRTYAPPDLFERSKQITGKTLADTWRENGITLTKTKNQLEQGCATLREWIHPIKTKDVQTGLEYDTARLTIDRDAAPNLVHSFLNIQKDKHRPEVYSNQPHNLTHSISACTYFVTEFIYKSIDQQAEERRQRELLYDIPYPDIVDNKITDSDLIM